MFLFDNKQGVEWSEDIKTEFELMSGKGENFCKLSSDPPGGLTNKLRWGDQREFFIYINKRFKTTFLKPFEKFNWAPPFLYPISIGGLKFSSPKKKIRDSQIKYLIKIDKETRLKEGEAGYNISIKFMVSDQEQDRSPKL